MCCHNMNTKHFIEKPKFNQNVQFSKLAQIQPSENAVTVNLSPVKYNTNTVHA